MVIAVPSDLCDELSVDISASVLCINFTVAAFAIVVPLAEGTVGSFTDGIFSLFTEAIDGICLGTFT